MAIKIGKILSTVLEIKNNILIQFLDIKNKNTIKSIKISALPLSSNSMLQPLK
tara:strand:+ start:1650 stop:1808 length:159 start_codon:yes stop_codon:yes gene_type:complete